MLGKKKPLSAEKQADEIRRLMTAEGKKASQVVAEHPELAEGIDAVLTAAQAERAPRGSGPTRETELPRLSRRPLI